MVLVGTPGVGKSSISTMLASSLDGIHINIGELVERERLYCGFDNMRESLIVDEKKVGKRVSEIIEQSDGYVVVDGHYAMDVVPVDVVFLTFVLRRSPDELHRTLKQRGYGEAKITENVAAEILDVCLFDVVETYGTDKICEIDVTQKTVEQVVDEITRIIDSPKRCRRGNVDWLTDLASTGRLEEFFKSF